MARIDWSKMENPVDLPSEEAQRKLCAGIDALEQEVALLRAQVEALGLELQRARDEALEEAARYHDRKGDECRAWLDKHDGSADKDVVAAWGNFLAANRQAALAIRTMKS